MLSARQRARGAAVVAFKVRAGITVLDDLRQEGCLKVRFPRTDGGAEAVLLNSSGGVAGGDRLDVALRVGAGAVAAVSAQAAERFYRALPDDPPARVRTHVAVAPGAILEWLPQETILFDGCAVDRALRVGIEGGARFLGVEMLVFGRTAMGEEVRAARLRDTIHVERDGVPILHDAIRLDGDIARRLDRAPVGGGARAVGTIVLVAPDADVRLDPLRHALAPFHAGASAWNGMLLARILAPNGACLRAAVVAGLDRLRDGRALPRVWMC